MSLSGLGFQATAPPQLIPNRLRQNRPNDYAFGPRNSVQLPHLDALEPNEQLVAGVDLETDAAFQADVVALVDFIIEPSRSVVVGNGHTVFFHARTYSML